MKELFKTRRQLFQKQCLRYLRYVLNDHFVLFLMIGLGFIMVQYRQLLANLPKTSWPLHLFLILAGISLSLTGQFNAYLEKPDQLFLLPKEKEVIQEINRASRRGFLFWSVLQLLLFLFLMPLALALSWPRWLFLAYVLAGLGLKWLRFFYSFKRLKSGQSLLWQRAVRNDTKQKQTVLKFFSLFTQVKGLRQTAKRRSYLDLLIKPFSKTVWTYLFVRAFVRSGDYLGLSFRLLLLSLLSLFFIRQDLVATALVLLFNYLLLFQLLALYTSYEYQYLTRLFPQPLLQKKHSLKTFLKGMMSSALFLESLVALSLFKNKGYVLILILVQSFFNQFYLNYKIKKLID